MSKLESQVEVTLPTSSSPPLFEKVSSLHGPDDASPTTSEWTARSIACMVGAFLASLCTTGFGNAGGVFQTWYLTHQLSHKTASQVSWIVSFTLFTMFIGAAGVGFVMDRFGVTLLITIGSVFLLLALFMMSLCQEFYQFLLAQGFLLGLSMALIIVPAFTTIPRYFNKHKGLAMGATVAGSSAGGVIWPIVLDQLLNHRNTTYGWTLRIVAFIIAPLLGICILTIQQPPSFETKSKQPQDKAILKDVKFLFLCAGTAVFDLGLFTPLFFISLYAEHLHQTASFAFYLTAILSGANFFGRIAAGQLGDMFGFYNMEIFSALASALICFCWTAVTSQGGLIGFCIAYGFVSGMAMALQMPCATILTTPETYGIAFGAVLAAGSITSLIGAPIAGALLGRGYLALSMFNGCMLILGGLLIAVARMLQSKSFLAKV